MPDLAHLAWPFFDEAHRRFGQELAVWAEERVEHHVDHRDVDRSCRNLVRALGEAGWLKAVVPAACGGLSENLDVRRLCVAREVLAWHDSLADFAFAMQGLGTGSISLYGSDALKAKYLPPVRDGRHIAAFALSEPEAGSDVSALATSATPDGPNHVRLNGIKTWISNGGIADHYVVFARTGEGKGAKGLSAFVVDADAPGFSVVTRIDVMAPHPLAKLRFADCRVPVANRLGAPGEGFKVAMATLDIFRSTVGAAALGLARRAFDEAIHRASTRKLFGAPLADLQLTQAALRRQRRRHRRRRAPDLPRRLDPRHRSGPHHPASRRAQNCLPPRWRSASSTAPCSCSAAMACAPASRSRRSIARSAPCASTRARPRCRS